MTDRIQLIDAYLDGRLDASSMAQLERWIESDPAAAELFAERSYLEQHLHERSQHDVLTTPTLRRSRSVWYAAAALALAVTAGWMLSSMTSTTTPQRAPQPPSVAMLTNLDSAVFADASSGGVGEAVALGSELSPGTLSLRSGSAQVMFHSTAVVDLTGPCVFEMTGPNTGRLQEGRLDAYVPSAARGFTITMTDGLRLVDLGTRFTAYTDASGHARACVHDGKVRVEFGTEHRVLGPGELATRWRNRLVVMNVTQPVAHMSRTVSNRGLDESGRMSHFIDPITDDAQTYRMLGLLDPQGRLGVDGTTLYLSWLTRGPNQRAKHYAGVSLFDRSGDRPIERLFIGKATNLTAFSYHVPGRPPEEIDVQPSTPAKDLRYPDDQPHRYVVRIDYRPGPDRVSVWLDPETQADEQAPPHVQLDDVNATFNSLRFGTHPDAADWRFDDLKLGTTWRSVMPAP